MNIVIQKFLPKNKYSSLSILFKAFNSQQVYDFTDYTVLQKDNKNTISLLSEEDLEKNVDVSHLNVGWSSTLSEEELEEEQIQPKNFEENPEFTSALHKFLQENAPDSQVLKHQARTLKGDYLHVTDYRGGEPLEGRTPFIENIFGWVYVDQNGQIKKNSYQRNTGHRLFTTDGIFKLEETMQEKLLNQIKILANNHEINK